MSYLDLTVPMKNGGVESCPGEPRGYFLPFSNIAEHGWASHQLLLYTHGGTHMDAPAHFIQGGRDVASLSLEAMIGPAMVADVDAAPDTTFTLKDIRWPRPPQPGDRIVLRTGWENRRGTSDYFTASPHLGLDVAQYLVEHHLALLGLDLPTPNRRYPREVHEILLSAGVVLIEALTNLLTIPHPYGQITCLPLPLVGLDGSPVRVVWLPLQPGVPHHDLAFRAD